MSSDHAPRLARNSAFYALKSVVALASMLLVTPFIFRIIGKDQYGIWALAGVMTSYAQLSDFGITESLVKYAAEYHANNDDLNLNRLANTAFVFLSGFAALIGGILILFLPFVTREILKIPVPLQEEALLIFRFSLLIFLFNMMLSVFSTLVISSQMIGYTCSINIATTLVGLTGTFFFLNLGWGLRGLLATNAIVALVTAALNIIVVLKIFPRLRFNVWRWVDRPMLQQIFTFSWKVQASNISQLLIFQIDRILLSRYLGLGAVAYYEVGSNAAYYAKTFLSVLFAPMVPAVSAMHARQEHNLITGLYQRSFKFMVMIALPFCFLVMALAHPFIRMWMGPGFELAAVTLQLLIPAYLVNVLTGPGTFILTGINRPDIGMRAALLAGGLNLVLCYVLVTTIGYYGLIIGITFSLVVSAAYFLVMFHHVMPAIRWSLYGKVFGTPLLFATPLALGLWYLDTQFSLAGLPTLVLSALVYVVMIAIFFFKSAYLDDFERQIFGGLIPFRRKDC